MAMCAKASSSVLPKALVCTSSFRIGSGKISFMSLESTLLKSRRSVSKFGNGLKFIVIFAFFD
jgi:hypothetical protein